MDLENQTINFEGKEYFGTVYNASFWAGVEFSEGYCIINDFKYYCSNNGRGSIWNAEK